MPMPNAPPCPRCGHASVWHPSLNQWGCDRCQLMNPMIQYLVLPSTASRPASPVTAVIKVLVSIVLIIAVIAISVALRLHR